TGATTGVSVAPITGARGATIVFTSGAAAPVRGATAVRTGVSSGPVADPTIEVTGATRGEVMRALTVDPRRMLAGLRSGAVIGESMSDPSARSSEPAMSVTSPATGLPRS